MDLSGYRFYVMTQEQIELLTSCHNRVAENNARLKEILAGLGYEKSEMIHSGGKFRGFIFPDGARPKGWVKVDRNYDALIPGKRSKAMRELRDELLPLFISPRHLFQEKTGGTHFEFLPGARVRSRGLWPVRLSSGDILGVPLPAEESDDFRAMFRWTGEGQEELKPSEVLARIEEHNEAIERDETHKKDTA